MHRIGDGLQSRLRDKEEMTAKKSIEYAAGDVVQDRRRTHAKQCGQGVLIERLPNHGVARVWRIYYPMLERIVREEARDLERPSKITILPELIEKALTFRGKHKQS